MRATSPVPRAQRALVVDDHPGTAEGICVVLGVLGHEARAACSGRAAIAEAAAFEPELVILDIGLVDMSGYDVARALRGLPGCRPFIAALTGNSRPEKRRLALEAGCDQYVLKPADASTVRAILEEMQSRTGHPRTGQPPP